MADPALIDAKFREAWMPYFCRAEKGVADLEDFSHEVEGGWLPVLDIFQLPPLTGEILAEVVKRKKLQLLVWMALGGESLKRSRSPGLIVWLVFFGLLRSKGYGLMDFWMPILP